MTFSFIIVIAILIGYFSPAFIMHAEKSAIESAREIDQQSVKTTGIFLSLAVIAIPTCFFLINAYSHIMAVNIFLMGVCVYFDIKRKWIPDPPLYAFLFTATIFASIENGNLVDMTISVASMLTPYIVLNAYGYIHRKSEWYIGSGDLYFVIPVALLVCDWIEGLLISSASLLLALIAICTIRTKQLPLLPFIYIPALIILAMKNPA